MNRPTPIFCSLDVENCAIVLPANGLNEVTITLSESENTSSFGAISLSDRLVSTFGLDLTLNIINLAVNNSDVPEPATLALTGAARSVYAGVMYSAAEAAFLHLQRTAGRLMTGVEAALKPYGLTHTQYNVLRILRGAGAEGRPCGEIAGDMIHRDADMTRLLDRLEKQGWVKRSRSATDRRVVTARITAAGLNLLAQLDAPVTAAAEGAMGGLTPSQLERLVNLLGRLDIS